MATSVGVHIDFSTNAKVVEQQIHALGRTLGSIEARSNNLSSALDKNKATSRALTGDLRAMQSFKKLNEEINRLAADRARILTHGYNFGAQDQFIKNTITANEKLRIQHKILQDNATAMVNMGKNTQWAGRQLVVGFTVPLTMLARTAVKAFSDIEKEVVKFRRVYGDAFTSTDELDSMTKAVKDLAQEWTKYGVAVNDTIQLAAQAAGAGFKGQDLTAQVNAATKASVLGQIDMQKSMKSTIAMQSAFKLSNKDLGKTINYLNQLENQTIVTLDDMTTAIPKAGTIVKGLGGSVKDLGTMMAALEEGGISAAEGANALKSGLGSLLNPSKEAKKALSSIGIDMSDLWTEAEKNSKGVLYVVEQLGKAMDDLGQTQRQQVMEELFGKHQFARMNALLDNINKGRQAMTAKGLGTNQLEAAIVAQQELSKLSSSNLTKFQAAIERLRAALAPVGEQVVKVLTPVVDFFTKLFEKFDKLPDSFKDIGTAIVIGVGVVAPVFLMLLGQIQNMIGNGMKLLNIFRGWGKDTKWVAAENMTLVETLSKIDAQLIAENALLTKNEALWKGRAAAAASGPRTIGGGGTAAGGGPVPVPVTTRLSLAERISKARRGFATGGPVGGSGNRDTIPALLTPGEFVVNKEASARYGNILGAMNSGTLPGFQRGRVIGMDPTTIRRSAKAKQSRVEKKLEGLTPQEAEVAKKKSKTKLFAYKHMEDSVITGIFNYIIKYLPELAEYVGKFSVQARQWDQSHIGPSAYQTLKGAIDKTTGEPTKPWNYSGDLIMDNHLINRNLNPRAQHPFTLGQARGYQHRKVKDPVEAIILSRFMNWRTTGGGTAFYTDLMDDNFLYMNLLGRTQKDITTQVKEKKGQGFNILRRAMGGIVPGMGNRDTVPAMLTPGESVITKSATRKYGPILSAMNRGTLGLFAKGKVDKGGNELFPKDVRMAMVDELRNNIVGVVEDVQAYFGKELKIGIKKLQKQIEEDVQSVAMSHAVPTYTEQGKKVYRPDIVAGTTSRENQAMLDLSKKTSQAALKATAETEKNVAVRAKYNEIIDKLANQEHILLKEEREYLAALMTRSEILRIQNTKAGKETEARKYAMAPSLQGVQGQAVIGGLIGMTPTNPSTGKPWTQADIEHAYSVQNQLDPTGKGRAPKKGMAAQTTVPTGGLDTPQARNKLNNGFAIATTALMLFGNGVTGATDSLGAFGTILDKVTPILLSLSYITPGAPGAIGGKLTGLARKLPGGTKFGLGAGTKGLIGGGIAGIGLGMAGNFIGGKVGGPAGGAISGAATGAGIGMMFGPWGAAIGAATGGLIGFAKALEDTRKAVRAANESMKNIGQRWDDVIKEIEDKFDIGGASTLADKIAGVSQAQNTELFKQFQDIMQDPSTSWGKMVEELKASNAARPLEEGRLIAELQTMTVKARASGMDEGTIKTLAQAFINSFPPEMRQGLSPNSYKVQETKDIINDLSNRLKEVLKTPPPEKPAFKPLVGPIGLPGLPAGGGANTGPGWAPGMPQSTRGRNTGSGGVPFVPGAASGVTTAPTQTKEMAANSALIGRYTGQMLSVIQSLTDQLSNLEKGSEEYEKVLKDLKAAQEANANFFGQQNMREGGPLSAAQKAAIEDVAFRPVKEMIASGKGAGLSNEELDKMLKNSDKNAIDLSMAAQQLMQAGVDISNWDAEKILKGGLAIVGESIANALASKYEALHTSAMADIKKLGEIKTNQAEELRVNAKEIKLSAAAKQQTKIDATLEIARIHLEEGALAEFVGKFNKAFGTSIDSFADAQYQIDKIGSKIRAVQLHRIEPLQEKANDLSRTNELIQRKIDKLEAQKAKRIEQSNKVYQKQSDILEEINRQNDQMLNKQKSLFDMASAIASGDVGAAVNAQIDMLQQENDAFYENQQKQAQAQQDAADTTAAPEDKEINKLKAEQAKNSEKIQKYDDKIYDINDKIVEPMQRKADLESEMLSNTQLDLKYQQDNIKGHDRENDARKANLTQAQLALIEAGKILTKEDEIRAKYKEQADEIATKYGIEGKGIDDISKKLGALDKKYQENMENAKNAATTYHAAINSIIDKGSTDIPVPGSSLDVMQDVMDYVYSTNPEAYSAHLDAEKKREADRNKNKNLGSNYRSPNDPTGGRGMSFARGGMVPSMLTPGEYVMGRDAVNRLGANTLGVLNRGGKLAPTPKEYATGGVVTGNPFVDASEALATDLLKKSQFADAVTAMAVRAPTPTGGYGRGSLGPPTKTGIPPVGNSIIQGGIKMIAELHELHAALTRLTSIITSYSSYASPLNHGHGRAMDMMVPMEPVNDKNPAWSVANWIKENYSRYGVTQVIFQDHIWTTAQAGAGWRKYKPKAWNPTDRHLNHIHVSAGQGSGTNGPYDDSVPRWSDKEYWAKKKRASGGVIPGGGGRDSVRAMLTPGEFVMRKSAVDRIGVNKLAALNRGPARFAGGGAVLSTGAELLRQGEVPNLAGPDNSNGDDTESVKTPDKQNKSTSKKFGRFWAVTNDTHIKGGRYYSDGSLHAEPWLKGKTKKAGAGVADMGTANTAVHALLPGTVTRLKEDVQAFGPNNIVITHADGSETRYAHLNPPPADVTLGGKVYGGQFLGVAAVHSRSVTFPNEHSSHLHFAWHGIPEFHQPPRHGAVPWAGFANKMFKGGIIRAASGGLVPGSGSQDTIRALLTPGEFVINKNAVSTIGTAPLKSLNQSKALGRGQIMPKLNQDQGVDVYNEYNLQFNILEAENADDVANTVLYKLERATRSKMRPGNVG